MIKKTMMVLALPLVFTLGYTLGSVSDDVPGVISSAQAHTEGDCSTFRINSCRYIPPNPGWREGKYAMYILDIANSNHSQTFLVKNDKLSPATGVAFIVQ